MSIDTENTFVPEDLFPMLLYAAVPNFLSSKFHHGSGCSNLLSSSSDSNDDDDMARKRCSTQPSSLAQELFTSCAANFEEDDMAALLHKGDWYQRVSESLKEHELGITVFDLNRDACPIVYANKAFQQLTGYSEGELLGKGYISLYPYNQHTLSRRAVLSSSAAADNATVTKKEQQRSQVHEKLLQIDSLASHPLKKKNGRAATHVNAYRLVPTPPPPTSCPALPSPVTGAPTTQPPLNEPQPPQQQQLVVGVHYSTEACGMGPVDSSILSQMDELIALLPYLVQPPDAPCNPRPSSFLDASAEVAADMTTASMSTPGAAATTAVALQQQGEKIEFSSTPAYTNNHHPGKNFTYQYLHKGEEGGDEMPSGTYDYTDPQLMESDEEEDEEEEEEEEEEE